MARSFPLRRAGAAPYLRAFDREIEHGPDDADRPRRQEPQAPR